MPGKKKKKKKEKEGTRPRWFVTCLPENPCCPAGPHLHTDLQQITRAVQSPLMLQIILVPKKPKITGLNDCRPVVLTPVAMKSFNGLVLANLKETDEPLLDPLQFAYRANRSVDDAVNMWLHFILKHLARPGTYVRILFIDFSSAFNTTSSHITLQPKTGCPLKLSRVEPNQYLDGRPPGKTRLLLEEVLVRPAEGAHPVVCVGPNTLV